MDWVHPVNPDDAFLSSSNADDDDDVDADDALQIVNSLLLSVN